MKFSLKIGSLIYYFKAKLKLIGKKILQKELYQQTNPITINSAFGFL
jgi:hypothetical protein